MKQTPVQFGFHMPAEWEHHNAVWLAWPYDDTTFPGRVPVLENRFVEIISAIHTSEPVNLLVLDDTMKVRVSGMLQHAQVDLSKVNFHIVDFQDVWTRDYGPLFLVNRQDKSLGWVKWQYNAYGKGEDPYFAPVLKDNNVFDLLTPPGRKFANDMVLEGGAIEVNGQGTLITTEQCLLNPNRNPNLTKQQIEQNLKDYLGVTKIIWLKRGLTNDHTDGHIDDLVKFVTPNKLVCAYEDDPNDENFKILDDNYQAIKNATDQDGQPFDVVKLPMPHMNFDDGTKAPVSYNNFYVGNTVILAAKFNDENDDKALGTVQACFPDRKVIAIDCRDIIYGGGTLHCMSQQQPSV
jgi:agmatine deiminase